MKFLFFLLVVVIPAIVLAYLVSRIRKNLRGICRMCGCTDYDCRGCIERTGEPCGWANEAHTLCTACLNDAEEMP